MKVHTPFRETLVRPSAVFRDNGAEHPVFSQASLRIQKKNTGGGGFGRSDIPANLCSTPATHTGSRNSISNGGPKVRSISWTVEASSRTKKCRLVADEIGVHPCTESCARDELSHSHTLISQGGSRNGWVGQVSVRSGHVSVLCNLGRLVEACRCQPDTNPMSNREGQNKASTSTQINL